MNTETLYQQRLARYVTAMRNEKPDRVPIRPFVAEFTAKYAGYTCQDVAHDYHKAFDAAVKCARDFDWDAVVPNMVYVWTGLAQALGLRYYGIPGIGIPATSGFNYIEPSEEQAFMKADEYDALIADPTAFLYEVWLPRVSTEVAKPGALATYRSHVAMVKSAMAMLAYFYAFGPQIQRLRTESGTPSAIAGIVEIVREAYPDPASWDPKSDYYDPKASPENPVWSMVDVRLVEIFSREIPLEELRGVKALAGMELVRRGSRLSVHPVTTAEFRTIRTLAEKMPADRT